MPTYRVSRSQEMAYKHRPKLGCDCSNRTDLRLARFRDRRPWGCLGGMSGEGRLAGEGEAPELRTESVTNNTGFEGKLPS